MTAIVLVGGNHALTQEKHAEVPTALVHIGGAPFLCWVTEWLEYQNFAHIVYATSHCLDKFQAWANDTAISHPTLCLDILSDPTPLGTAGAALLCSKRFPADICLITNGDSLLLTDLKPALDLLKNNTTLDGIIFGRHASHAGRFGTLEINDHNFLTAFKEKEAGTGLVNVGLYLLKKSLLDTIPTDKYTSLEYHCFPEWLAQHKKILVIDATDKPYIDMGLPDTSQFKHVKEPSPI
jgi:NDP-sugar pyrophosphorylase family protein